MPVSKGRSQAASSESPTPPNPLPESPQQSNGPAKHVSSACQACRQARSKCSGEQPCGPCARRKFNCVYTKNEDGRRKTARKRKVEDLENDSALLNDLIYTVQQSDDGQVAQVVALIRSNPLLDEVKTYVRQQLATIRVNQRELSPELEDLHEKVDFLQRKRSKELDSQTLQQQDGTRALDIARLTDSPPYRVPAAPWTKVTTDDTLVSHLLSVLLIWDKPFHNLMDEALFLHDMQKGKLESTYCSPFLVNALLGYACAYANYDEAKFKRGAPSKLMTRFIEEAISLLEQESSQASLTTVAGLMYLHTAVAVTGDDADAYKYLKRGAAMCRDLEIKFKNIQSDRVQGSQHALSRALDMTCWAVFNTTTMVSAIYQYPPEQPIPTRNLPSRVTDVRRIPLYPQNDLLVPWTTAELQYYRSTLSLIVRDIALFLSRKPPEQGSIPGEALVEEMLGLHARLLVWHGGLPERLKLSEQSSPGILTLQSYYVSLIMMMYAPLAQKSIILSESHLARVQALRKGAALEAVRVCRIHHSSYGNVHICVIMTQPVLLALYCLVWEKDSLAFRAEITDLCIFFRAISRRFPFAMVAFRMLRVQAEQSKKVLPPETEALFEDFDRNDWAKRQMKQITSLYPVIGDVYEAGSENMKMTDFLDKMEKLQIDGIDSVDGAQGS